MAVYDLEEQEQIDQLKHFWKRYGNAISWLLIVVLGAFAAFNGWQYWQRKQGAEAAVMYEQTEAAVQAFARADFDGARQGFEALEARFGKSKVAASFREAMDNPADLRDGVLRLKAK